MAGTNVKLHYRKCWDCQHIAEHSDNIAPEVNCRLCKSMDTRPLRRVELLEMALAELIDDAVLANCNDGKCYCDPAGDGPLDDSPCVICRAKEILSSK